MEVLTVPSTSTEATLRKLRCLVATHGLPEIIVSDNGAGFTIVSFPAPSFCAHARERESTPLRGSWNVITRRGLSQVSAVECYVTDAISEHVSVHMYVSLYRVKIHRIVFELVKEDV